MTKRSGKGVEYAESAEEAETLLLAEAERIGLDREWVPDETWNTTKDIAVNPVYGLLEAYKTLLKDLEEIHDNTRRDARQARVDAVWPQLREAATRTGAHVLNILTECRTLYVEGRRVNFEHTTMTAQEFRNVCQEWEDLRTESAVTDQDVFHHFHWEPIQDKAAANKGNVGNTIAKRTVQGCVLVYVGAVKFNAHINIKG
ncbi:hypothetical protein ACFYYH_18770 [Streptomyces sp. NPDC002018]|uniref:hypothetical protein n=1 Tax=Streptomyces sp. NPDC002018 TaxID=3364629 RepID=UPI0036B85574